MWKKILAVALLLALMPTAALASGQYIIPDSNTRYLTRQELWEWSYESLGFILNEIFARHGYNFEVGKKYYNYFGDRPWYTPNQDPDNRRACYPKLSSLEWSNERLVKDVRQEMRDQNTKNSKGKNYLDYIEDSFDVLSGFFPVEMKANQKFPVYSAPSAQSYRGAGGKASLSTNGAVYAAGWEDGWLLVMYLTNNGSVRVGYVDGAKIKGKPAGLPSLDFEGIPMTLQSAAQLTDDPAMGSSVIARLPAGGQLTYLTEYQNRYAWAYVETTLEGELVRGFVQADALGLSPDLGVVEDSIGEDKQVG